MSAIHSTFSSNKPSVLIIGASGRLGTVCIQQLAQHPRQPKIHAFCRDSSKLSKEVRKLCSSVQQGNARNSNDIEKALEQTRANWIILSIGNGDNVAKNDIRQASAQATVQVLQKPAFQHVYTVVVSSTGAGSSKIVIHIGLGTLLSFYLRHILWDHTQQEAAFMDTALRERTIVVRATSLTDHKATGNLVEFGDLDVSPSLYTDRGDLSEWIAHAICDEATPRGRVVNVTGMSK